MELRMLAVAAASRRVGYVFLVGARLIDWRVNEKGARSATEAAGVLQQWINDLRPDVLVVPITSQAGPLRVRLPDVGEGTGLRFESYAKCEVVGPVHKSRLKRRIGQLPERAWPTVEAGLARVLGLPELDVAIGSPDTGGDRLD